MNIIIIDHEPYSPHKKERYFINEFIKDKISIEYWNVCNALPYLKSVKYNNQILESGVKYFKSYKSLLKSIEAIDPSSIIILEVWFTWSTVSLFRKLKAKNIKFIRIDYFYTIVSFLAVQESKINRFLSTGSFVKSLALIPAFISKLSLGLIMKVLKLNESNLLFLTGRRFEDFQRAIPKKSITYFDVLKFEEIKALPSLIEEKYIVFLDIYLTGHPDLKRSNLETIDADTYYRKMNLFFDEIEKDTGYQVVIAAHPQANYTNEYGDRIIKSGKTAELVNHCEFVLTHGSLSINFAVLSQKSIVYIFMDEFIQSKNYLQSIYGELEKAAEYFNSTKINIDHYINIQIENLQFDESAYSKYLNDYIYSTEYPKENYQIIKESLLALSASHEK